MKRILLPVILFAGVLAAQIGPGPGPMMGNGPGGGQHRAPRMEALKQATGLTDAQIEDLRALRKELRDQVRAKLEEGKQIRQQLRDGLTNPDTTDAQLGQLLRQAEQFKTDLRQLREAKHEQAVKLMNSWGLNDKLEQLQKAMKLAPAVRQAGTLGLLEPPVGRRGRKGGRMGAMGFHGHGWRARR